MPCLQGIYQRPNLCSPTKFKLFCLSFFFFFLNGVLMLKCILFSLMLEVPFTFSETQVSILLNFFVTQLGFKDFEIACIKAFGVLH